MSDATALALENLTLALKVRHLEEKNERLRSEIDTIHRADVTEINSLRAEIERLREALDTIANGPRDVEKTYAELFAEVKIEARAALRANDE